MLSYSRTMTVTSSPQEAFDYITDPSKGTEWAGSATSVRAEGEPGVGRKIFASANMIIKFEIEQTVTAYDPPSHYAFSAQSPIKVAYDFVLTPDGDGTRIDAKLDADPGKFIPGGKLLLKGRFKKEFEGDMDRLKAKLS